MKYFTPLKTWAWVCQPAWASVAIPSMEQISLIPWKCSRRIPATEKIVLIGEIGGTDEEQAAEYISKYVTKPNKLPLLPGEQRLLANAWATPARLSREGQGWLKIRSKPWKTPESRSLTTRSRSRNCSKTSAFDPTDERRAGERCASRTTGWLGVYPE